jgi:1,4-dihydroxy-6-naphthoate synthase
MPTYTLGHSPDSDDAFMFYALAKGLIDTGGLEFEHTLQDIETLNRRALRAELDITALSVHAYTQVADTYALMSCGASIGEKYGPLVVSRSPLELGDLKDRTVALPGTMTTAYLALRLAAGDFEYVVVPFDEVFEKVEAGEADAGLVIHEGQLTYRDAGLKKVVDLGEWWFEETGLPLPLGVNGVRKSFGQPLMERLTGLVQASIVHALEHRKEAVEYALQFARGMTESLADEFVGMYVNDFTVDMGERGRRAIEELLDRGHRAGVIPQRVDCEFVYPGE